ncbi:fibrobacter succinogenes major paralogous domain-containing protein [Flavobacterium sp.]|uniref:fibrobacter succinogenes major paralogous domain-containing protein n=1 Tax=Flavobacterium sp. TaxID=239 RepID=UPI003BD5731D
MKNFLLLSILSVFLFSCSKSDSVSGTNSSIGELNVQTYSIEKINFTNAKCVGIVTYGQNAVSAAGICWSTSPNPTISGLHTTEIVSATSTSFTSTLSPLSANTTYYARAYATDSKGTVYGTQISFKTLNILFTSGGGVTDIDGENYGSVKLNGKEWMKKNLDVSKYKNGDDIPQITDVTQWDALTTGAWCYYENDTANGPIYGKLYNWYAITDPRGLAPAGWHIPTDTEWSELATFLGGESEAGRKLKENSTISTWDVTTNYATNQSGFTATPAGTGYLNYHLPAPVVPAAPAPTLADLFKGKTKVTYWWSATTTGSTASDLVWTRNVNSSTDQLVRSGAIKSSGLSVRCVKN